MLPSYTVLPIRATTPPMSDGSTSAVELHLLAGQRAQTRLEAPGPVSATSGAAEVTAARTMLRCASRRSR